MKKILPQMTFEARSTIFPDDQSSNSHYLFKRVLCSKWGIMKWLARKFEWNVSWRYFNQYIYSDRIVHLYDSYQILFFICLSSSLSCYVILIEIYFYFWKILSFGSSDESYFYVSFSHLFCSRSFSKISCWNNDLQSLFFL